MNKILISTLAHFLLHLSPASSLIFFWVQLDCSTSSSNCVGHHENLILAFSFQCHLCHLHEGIVYWYVFLCWCFVVWDVSVLFAPLLSFASLHLPVRLFVDLIAYQDKWEWVRVLGCSMLDESVSPFSQVFETLLVSDIIDKCTAVSPSVESVP